jgi:hypothetical protein
VPHSLVFSLSLLGPLIFRHACSLPPQSLPLCHSALVPLTVCQVLTPALLALLGFLSLTLSCHTVMDAVIVSIDDDMTAKLWTALIYEPLTQAFLGKVKFGKIEVGLKRNSMEGEAIPPNLSGIDWHDWE